MSQYFMELISLTSNSSHIATEREVSGDDPWNSIYRSADRGPINFRNFSEFHGRAVRTKKKGIRRYQFVAKLSSDTCRPVYPDLPRPLRHI